MTEQTKKKRGYSIGQLAIASLGFGAVSIFWTIYNSFVPLILDEKLNNLGSVVLSATVVSTLVGFIMTIDNFFGLIFQPIFGRKSDHMRSRFGKRLPYLLVGVPVCAVLFVLIPLMARIDGVAGILLMMVVIITFNFIMSTWRAPCVAIMPDMVPSEYQSDGNAVVNMVSAVTTIIATLSATILGAMGFRQAIADGDYLSVFVFGALLAVLNLLLILFFVKWPDNRGEKIIRTEAADAKKESLRNLNLPSDVKWSMFIMMAALFFSSGASDGFDTYFTLYATKLLAMDAARATLIRTAATLGAVLLAVPAGILGRKIGRKKTILIGLGIRVLCHGLMFCVPLFGLTSADGLITVINFVYAAGFIMVNINTLPIMLAIGGKARFGAFTGYYYTATFTAAVVCPTIIGFLVGVSATYNAVQGFCCITALLSLICVANVRHGEKMSDEDEAALAKAVEAAED